MLVKFWAGFLCACILLFGGCGNSSKADYEISAVQLAQAMQQGREPRRGSVYRITGKVYQVRDRTLVLEAGEVSWLNLQGTAEEVGAYKVGQQVTVLGRYVRYERLESCGGLGHDFYFEIVK